jgi:secreted trypsin-like serine protease
MRAVLLLALLVASVYSQTTGDQTSINPSGCGRRLSAFGKRAAVESEQDPGKIVGGQVATAGDWNWMVIVKTNGRFFCGSSLINSIWLLTAAHCTSGMSVSTLSVQLGVHNQNSPESWVVSRNIARIIQHASYSSSTMRNDISLMKMASAITYNQYIGPVCLPASGASYAGQTATAVGWGTTTSGGSVSNTLRYVNLLVRTDAQCTSSFSSGSIHTATMLCAGVKGDNMDTCQGDSGGPLSVANSNGIHYQIGVTSWGIGCGDVGVYAHVANFISWITSNVSSN